MAKLFDWPGRLASKLNDDLRTIANLAPEVSARQTVAVHAMFYSFMVVLLLADGLQNAKWPAIAVGLTLLIIHVSPVFFVWVALSRPDPRAARLLSGVYRMHASVFVVGAMLSLTYGAYLSVLSVPVLVKFGLCAVFYMCFFVLIPLRAAHSLTGQRSHTQA